jgi:DNA-binding response OmpR family regulator
MSSERRDAAQSAKEGRPLEAGSPSAETQQLTVLVAEDEETIAETLAMIVEDAGYLALVARDGREALALARQHRPQLIITDLMMPYLSGAELIAAVHGAAAAQGYVPPPIVVVTAASRVVAQQAGADIVITKPFDVSKIEAAMERLLGDQPS